VPYSEPEVISLWKMLTARYANRWNILGADLFNEPFMANWGGKGASDWQL
jgi:hypothetical protein